MVQNPPEEIKDTISNIEDNISKSIEPQTSSTIETDSKINSKENTIKMNENNLDIHQDLIVNSKENLPLDTNQDFNMKNDNLLNKQNKFNNISSTNEELDDKENILTINSPKNNENIINENNEQSIKTQQDTNILENTQKKNQKNNILPCKLSETLIDIIDTNNPLENLLLSFHNIDDLYPLLCLLHHLPIPDTLQTILTIKILSVQGTLLAISQNKSTKILFTQDNLIESHMNLCYRCPLLKYQLHLWAINFKDNCTCFESNISNTKMSITRTSTRRKSPQKKKSSSSPQSKTETIASISSTTQSQSQSQSQPQTSLNHLLQFIPIPGISYENTDNIITDFISPLLLTISSIIKDIIILYNTNNTISTAILQGLFEWYTLQNLLLATVQNDTKLDDTKNRDMLFRFTVMASSHTLKVLHTQYSISSTDINLTTLIENLSIKKNTTTANNSIKSIKINNNSSNTKSSNTVKLETFLDTIEAVDTTTNDIIVPQEKIAIINDTTTRKRKRSLTPPHARKKSSVEWFSMDNKKQFRNISYENHSEYGLRPHYIGTPEGDANIRCIHCNTKFTRIQPYLDHCHQYGLHVCALVSSISCI